MKKYFKNLIPATVLLSIFALTITSAEVFGPNWTGTVITDTNTAVGDTATINADLCLLQSDSINTAANGNQAITLTNSHIVPGTIVRADVYNYSNTYGTHGIPVVSISGLNTTAHTCIINISNPGTNALAGRVYIAAEVLTEVNLGQ